MDLFMLKHPTFGEEGNRKHNVPNVQKTNGYIYVPLRSIGGEKKTGWTVNP